MHDTLLTVFTGILAAAVLMQSLLFFGIYRAIRTLAGRMDGLSKDLLRNATAVSEKVDQGVAAVRKLAEGFEPVREQVAATAEIVYRRVVDLDAFLSEATDAARLEIFRVQDAITSASRKAEETLSMLRDGILSPLQEISALSRGIRAAFEMLFHRRRSPSGASAQDEEMFI